MAMLGVKVNAIFLKYCQSNFILKSPFQKNDARGTGFDINYLSELKIGYQTGPFLLCNVNNH